MAEGQVRALRALKAAGYFKAKITKLDVEQHFVTLYNCATDFVHRMEELNKQLEALPGDHPKRAVLIEILEGSQSKQHASGGPRGAPQAACSALPSGARSPWRENIMRRQMQAILVTIRFTWR